MCKGPGGLWGWGAFRSGVDVDNGGEPSMGTAPVCGGSVKIVRCGDCGSIGDNNGGGLAPFELFRLGGVPSSAGVNTGGGGVSPGRVLEQPPGGSGGRPEAGAWPEGPGSGVEQLPGNSGGRPEAGAWPEGPGSGVGARGLPRGTAGEFWGSPRSRGLARGTREQSVRIQGRHCLALLRLS